MDPKQETAAARLRRFLRSDRGLLLLLWLLMFTERLLYTLWDRTQYSLIVSDSTGYYQAGLDFARTGRILYYGYPTALIMPGTPVLIGLLARLLPEGPPLILAVRLLWMLMGSLVPLFLYKSLRLFAPKWCAFAASLVYLLPWCVEIDGYLLTECPYYLFFSMALYFTLKMGEGGAPRDIWLYALSVLGALMFRANILSFLPLTFLYLIVKKTFSWKELLRRAGAVALVLALFIVPWSVRNWRLYHAFIPVTYGVGNPMLEGTYQGEGFPTDAELAELDDGFSGEPIVRQKHPELYDENGELLDEETRQYVGHMINKEIGLYRLRQWWRMRPGSLLRSYLYVKPRSILNWVWYYIEIPGLSALTAHRLRQLNFLFCGLTLLLSLLLKKHRKTAFFLAFAYFVGLYIIATSYAIDRYAQMIMPYRYLLAGLGLHLLCLAREKLRQKKRA